MVAREGSSDGKSKTTHMDGIARWPLRAGWAVCACGGNLLRDGWRRSPEPEVPAKDVPAGSSAFDKWSAGTIGWGGSRKRGINPVDEEDAWEGSGQKQEHRSSDARGQAISK